MKKPMYLILVLVLSISFMGCSATEASGSNGVVTTESQVTSGAEETTTQAKVVATETITVASFTETVTGDDLELTGESHEIVLEDESITITEAGTYYISGTISNGQIIVDAEESEAVQLVLRNVDIHCDYSAPIYVVDGDVVMISSEGDANILSVSGDLADNLDGVDGVIYSKSDLIFNGTGSLTISSEGTHGIVGKDDLEFVSGTYEITAGKDGIKANDSVSVVDATIHVVADGDGIQVDNDENMDKGYIYSENSIIHIETEEDALNASNYIYIASGEYTIDAGQDGIQGEVYVYIMDGSFDISTGGGYQGVLNSITMGEGSGNTVSETDKLSESMKGIKADDIIIEGGQFEISSYEDGLNANNNIVINGGSFLVNAGDEAFTAHNLLEINDGSIVIENGYEGLEGDYITINGGDIAINVLDDGINGGESYSLVTIAGGNLTVSCQGDGLDSNGDMVISGGYIVLDVNAIYAGGDGNVDVTGTLTYTGGTLVDASGATIDPTEVMEGGRPGMEGDGGGRRR